MEKIILNPRKILSKKKPEKGLLLSLKKHAGRDNRGRITVRHQGGGVKQLYRLVDFGQNRMGVAGKVIALEYDPYRTAFLALIEYGNEDKAYLIAADKLKVGDEIICAKQAEIRIGNRMEIGNIPVGTQIYNIELEPGRGGRLSRSAGASAIVLAHEGKYTNIEMPSSEIRKVLSVCFASIGSVSHPEWRYTNLNKAGTSRRRGKRPGVRGTVMNPVDHPHGGGEGRQPLGMHPKTPWGKPALGVKTRGKRWSDKFIVSRRKKKKKN